MNWRRSNRRPLSSHLARIGSAVASNPRRAMIVSAVGVALLWLILTRSLAYALAEVSPEAALWLNPQLPRALLALADREREKLVAGHAGRATSRSSSPEKRATSAIAPFKEAEDAAQEERSVLRARVRDLASRALVNAPLNARAVRLIAEVTDDKEAVRYLMNQAVRRSRRESAAVFWLMDDSFERGDFADVVYRGDILLRTRPQLAGNVMEYFGRVADDEQARQRLVAMLASERKWRGTFFNTMPKTVEEDEALLNLLVELKDAGSPPSPQELEPFVDGLVAKQRIEMAYNAWLQLLPNDQLTSMALVHGEGFTENPSGLPFEWTVNRGQNTMVDFVPIAPGKRERALRYRFGTGRAVFPEADQILMLPPGDYRLEGAFQGLLAAKRGLKWELRCRGGKTPLGETEMLYGSPKSWQSFAVELTVPDQEDCRAQTLRVYHPARSASEQLISGEIAFRGIRLARLKMADK
jgi:hypothetical protein